MDDSFMLKHTNVAMQQAFKQFYNHWTLTSGVKQLHTWVIWWVT